MKTKTVKPNEPFDTTRLDFLMAVDRLLRTAEETKALRDRLVERADRKTEVPRNEQ